MARRGRQPKAPTQLAGGRKQPKSDRKGKRPAAGSGGRGRDDDELDVYSYSTDGKGKPARPRGDIDPQARAGPLAGRTNKKRPRAHETDEDALGSDDEDEDDHEPEDGDDLNTVDPDNLPAGLWIGGDGEEGDFGGQDEDIDSELGDSDADSDDRPPMPSEPAEIDLDESGDDQDGEESGEFLDAAAMLDMNMYPSEDDESGSEQGDDSSEVMSDGDSEGHVDRLDSFIDNLDSKKRSGSLQDDGNPRKRKRTVLKEKTEAFPEGEFAVVGRATDGSSTSNKVQLDDLLSTLAADPKDARFAALRKSLKPLAAPTPDSLASMSKAKSHLKAAGPLAAPLPGRLQDKVEREAAYEKTKEETDKWNETVRRMKGESGLGAEGARKERLTLPLATGPDPRAASNSNEWESKFGASNALELTIESLLASSNMSASAIQKREKEALATLDPADLAARQAELRRQRDLLFRAERKAKRVAKIKSKAYRRIHRRKGKEGKLSLEDLAELDNIDGGNRVEEEKARLEVERARERASLKHSTKSGRWSQTVGDIQGLDEERNAAVRDMVKRRDELRKKITGDDDESEGDEFASDRDDDSVDEDADYNAIRADAFDELTSLERKESERAAESEGGKAKGVMNMKFMKDAMARSKRQADQQAEELRQDLARMDREGSAGSDSSDEDDAAPATTSVQGNLGRLVFGATAGADPATAPSSKTKTGKDNNTTKLSSSLKVHSAATPAVKKSPLSTRQSQEAVVEDDVNPWLAGDYESSSTKVSRKANKASRSSFTDAAVKVATKADKARSKTVERRAADADDARVEIEGVLSLESAPAPAPAPVPATMSKSASKANGHAQKQKRNQKQLAPEEDDDDDDSLDEEEIDAQRGKGPAALRQRELVARAFADDDVVRDFEAEKQRQIDLDAPKEIDETLPGWGSWAGKGVRKSKKQQQQAKKFIKVIPGIAASERADAKLSHVIISEKKDKKAAKYMIKDLPFPYTSAAQHEHKLRTPLGAEWAASTTVRDRTRPSIEIKPGVTIRPVDRKVV